MFSLFHRKAAILCAVFTSLLLLSGCSSQTANKQVSNKTLSKLYNAPKGHVGDPIVALSSLSEHQRNWKGTRYRLGGTSRRGVDCSGFMQITFRDLFGIDLPRTTTEQARYGRKVAKSSLQAGDLVFFKTGRGPNGKHVGVYVKNGQFLHASTKGGVIYSDINSPYWSRTFWQARRL